MITWAQNFEDQSTKIRELVGEEKYRAWRMYLGGSVKSFVNGNVTVNQFLIHKSGKHPKTIPQNRRYQYENSIGDIQ